MNATGYVKGTFNEYLLQNMDTYVALTQLKKEPLVAEGSYKRSHISKKSSLPLSGYIGFQTTQCSVSVCRLRPDSVRNYTL